jgi:hypothetical protein
MLTEARAPSRDPLSLNEPTQLRCVEVGVSPPCRMRRAHLGGAPTEDDGAFAQ